MNHDPNFDLQKILWKFSEFSTSYMENSYVLE